MKKPPDPHYRHRFPAELISHAVWLYHVFSLSFRDVELILAERGVVVSYESIRRWCLKFGASFAGKLHRRRPRPGDKWYLDEVFIRIRGELHYLWLQRSREVIQCTLGISQPLGQGGYHS
jgi:putative transposase